MLLKVLVCRCNNPDVALDSFATTHALKRSLLKNTQQFDLHLVRHVPDLIEKQRATLGEFESTFSTSNSARKCAFLVTEQFTLKKLARNGAAINRNKGTVCAFRAIVNQARNDFFTSARLALKQNGGVSRSNFGNKGSDISNSVTDTHQATIEVFEVALRCGVLGRHGHVSRSPMLSTSGVPG